MVTVVLDFIKLFSGVFLGSFASFLNINLSESNEFINFHIALANGLLGLIIGVFTLVFLYWQIRKIKRDFKNKKL